MFKEFNTALRFSGAFFQKVILSVFLFLFSTSTFAQTVPRYFTIEGRFYIDGSPVDEAVDVQFEVVGENSNCVLFKEEHANVNVSSADVASKGMFSLQLGSGNHTFPANLTTIFSNQLPITGEGSCTYSAVLGDSRKVKTSVRLTSAGGAYVHLDPDTLITSVPSALIADYAETLKGLGPTDFFRNNGVSDAAKLANQTKLQDLLVLSPTDISTVISGGNTNYVRANSTGAQIPSFSVNPTGVAEGQMWYNLNDKKFYFHNGTAATELNAGDSTKLPLTGGTMTGAITMGSSTNFALQDLLSTGHITMAPQKAIILGRYDNGQQTTLIGTLGTPNAGAMWFNQSTGKLMYWSGTAAFEVSETTTGGGDISAVNTATGSALSGGVTSGAANLQVLVDGATIEISANALRLKDGGVTATKLAANSVTETKLNNDAVTSAKILDGTIISADINNVSIGKISSAALEYFSYMPAGTECLPDQILKWDATNDRWLCADDAVGTGDITNVIAGNGLTGGATSGAATLSVVVDNSTIEIASNQLRAKDLGITTAKLADTSVTTAKLGDGSVATGKLVDGSVTLIKLASGSVDSSKIVDNSIVNADINASAAIAWSKINKTGASAADLGGVPVDRLINTNTGSGLTGGGDLSANRTLAVDVDTTSIGIASNKVHVVDGGISSAKLAANAVSTTKIADANITTAKIADGAVSASKLASSAVTTVKILDANVTTAKLADGAVTNTKISDVGVGKITSANGQYFSYMPNGAECDNDGVLKWDWTNDRWICGTVSSGVTAHSGLTGLTADDHTQYVLLGGRGGGQTIRGGSAANNSLTLDSTSNATKGFVLLQPTGGNVGIGTTNPQSLLHVTGTVRAGQICDLTGVNCKDLSTSWASDSHSLDASDGSPVDALFVDATGRVGIGATTSLAAALHIAQDISTILLKDTGAATPASAGFVTNLKFAGSTNADAGYVGYSAANELRISSGASTAPIVFMPSGSEWMRLTPSGNLGIGTDAPTARLDVVGSTAGQSILTTSATATGLLIHNNGSSSVGLKVQANGVAATFTGGNVGIGTTAPAQPLDVVGNVKATQFCLGADCRSAWPTGGGGGTVTSISTGAGLTGGPITGSGTISLAMGYQRVWTGPTVATVLSVTCPAGKSVIGGGCQSSTFDDASNGWPDSNTSWRCRWGSSVAEHTAWAICANVGN